MHVYIYLCINYIYINYIYIYICICINYIYTYILIISIYHHYHHVALSARVFLTLSRHTSLLSIASVRSSRVHPVSAQSCCMYVRARRSAFDPPCEGVHWSTSLVSSFLLLQQCPTCPVHLILIVFVMCGRWPSSCCFVGCCHQDLFNIARSIS